MDKQEFTGLEIAVVGMACKFPGASNIHEFWDNLTTGKESISRFSDDELLEYGVQEKELSDPNYVKAKGLIKDAEYFDASFFGISPTEANVLDPQFRVLLQCAYNSLEDAGYNFGDKDNNTGVFVGGAPNFNWQMECFKKIGNLHSEQFSSLISNDKDFISTRLSYLLDLHGHSQTVYTACSTSLVAIDMACQSLLTGKCDVTLAGGVSLSLPYKSGYTSESGMFMSKDGHTRSFDVEATGTIWSDGAGTVVLKRLEDALADGDNIHAIIKGSATNNDGNRKVGYTAPSVKGQSDVILKAVQMAEVPLESISYIEGHGSATTIGDKIEINALKDAFKGVGEDFSCAIGSVKSNFGHLNVAAGIAGFIKGCLMLKHATIPPTLNFKNPNSELTQSNSTFFVNNEPIKLENPQFPLRLGINSFGIGGTNVHIVLEKAPAIETPEKDDKHSVVCLSANTPSALNSLSKNLAGFIESNTDIDVANLAYTLQTGREHLKYRKAFVVKDAIELKEALAKEQKAIERKEYPNLVFMFPGMGGFSPKMGKDLYTKESAFRLAMDNCFSIIAAKTGTDFKTMMYGDTEMEIPADFLNPQLMVFSFEYSMAVLLQSWGIVSNTTIGYSLGEYVAACIAGVFSLEDVLAILIERGRLINTLDTGGMFAIPLPKKEIEDYFEEGVSIAIDNGASVVVAGHKDNLQKMTDALKKDDILVLDILDKYAVHTAEMNPIIEEFTKILSEFTINTPTIPMVSNVTGDWCNEEYTTTDYWIKHLAETVDFSKVVNTLVEKENDAIYLELGVGNFLGILVKRALDSDKAVSHVSLSRSENRKKNDDVNVSDHTHLMKALASIWEYGGAVDWRAFHADKKRIKLSLPTYPFEGLAYSLKTGAIVADAVASNELTRKEDVSSWFYVPSWKKKPLALSEDQLQESRTILILDRNQSEEVANRLSRNEHKVIQVAYGTEFEEIGKYSYRLNYNKKEALLRLFKKLDSEEVVLDTILDFTSISEGKENKVLERTIALFQSVNKTKNALEKLDYIAISSGLFKVFGTETITPEKSGIISTTKIVPQENPNINCRLIEIDQAAYENQSGGFYKAINHELYATDSIVSYRGKYRWSETYEPYPIQKSETGKSYIKNEGTYIVVGGLGDVGFTITQYILENFESNIVLVGRSKVPEKNEWEQWIQEHGVDNNISKKIIRLQKLNDAKGQVSLMQADSTSLEQMTSLFQAVETHYGSIEGVFYSVGDIDNVSFDLVNTMSNEQLLYHLPMKVKGLSVLKTLIDQNSLDFAAVMSSFSSVLGGLGMVGYAASNQYVDSFVTNESNLNEETKWMSFNFSYWDMEGDGADFQERSFLKMDKIGDDISNTSINVRDGRKVFDRLLSVNNDEAQIVVSPIDFSALKEKFQNIAMAIEEEETETVSKGNRVSDIPFVAPITEVEKALAKIWEELFGFEIGLQDDFFQLGGDSLSIIKLISKIQKRFDVAIDIRQIFKNTSFIYQLNLIEEASKNEFVAIQPAPKKEYYPQSDAQRRFYILNQMAPEILTYNVPAVIEVEGDLNTVLCEEVFKSIIQRHENLRTSFHLVEGLPVQKIHDGTSFALEVLEIENPSVESVMKAFQRPFDLSRPELFRAGICKTPNNSFFIVTDIHHIIIDRVTFGLIIEDFVALYNESELEAPTISYKDYSEWQQGTEYLEELDTQEEFWLSQFETVPKPLSLAADLPRVTVSNFNASSINFELSQIENEALKGICLEQKTTMFTLLLAVYHVLLSKLSNQEDIVVGSSVVGRQRSDLEKIMGVFVNTLPLRSKVTLEESFEEYLANFKEGILQCFANQEYPFERLVDKLNVSPELTRNPLFDVMFEYFNFSLGDVTFPDFSIKDIEFPTTTSEFDLRLKVVVKDDGQHSFNLDYRTDLFAQETIERFIGNFKNIVSEIIQNVTVKLGEINVLTPMEEQQLVESYTATSAPYDMKGSLNTMFNQQVANSPERVALRFGDETLTYGELNTRANKIANYLIHRGIVPGNLVGLMLDRSIDMIVGILGILKTGAGYLPLDPSLPEKRIGYMMNQGRAVFLLTQEQNVEQYSSYLPVSAISAKEIDAQAGTDVALVTHSGDLAYCIFTSGSTGNPKGVKMDHRGVMNLVKGLSERVYDVYEGKPLKVALLASYAFDASVQQIFGALLQGHSLYITDDETRKDGAKLLSFYNDNKIDLSDGTPTHLGMVLNAAEDSPVLTTLSSWILAGESLSKGLVNGFLSKFGTATQLYNFYGPTETCVDSTAYKIIPDELKNYTSIPIGKPLPNERVYITDNLGRLVPAGVTGELCIAGDGLALGYVGDEPLTTERFDTNWIPWEDKVYRTGDMARWLPDGNLEFVGRKDNQVKLRGYRIELSEIEFQLNTHERVAGCTIVAKELEGEKHLVAYYQSNEAISISEIRDYLSALVPDYMVPSYFVHMESFPLTANGKIDKNALPDHEISREDGHVAPRNEVETKLVAMWAKVLKLEEDVIGVNNSFFEFGGDSLRMVFLANSINKAFEVKLSLKEIMANPTVANLSALIAKSVTVDHFQIPVAESRDYYPLSPSQKRMYFIYEYDTESIAYNVPMAAVLKGVLDKERLERAFQKLIQRHESLRTVFELVDGKLVQRVLPTVDFTINHLKKAKQPIDTIHSFIKPFDLSRSPLVRVGLVPVSKKEHIIVLDCHHISSDEVTNAILLKDFAALYKGESLPELRIQYKDYVLWQEGEQQQQEIAKHREYWLNKFSNELATLELPYDYPRPKKLNDESGNCQIEISHSQAASLKKLAKSEGLTMYTLFLALYNVLLHKLSNQEDIVIGTPVAGRRHADLETITGVFINTLPIRNSLKGDMSFKEFVKQVQKGNSKDLDHQLYPYEDLVDTLNIERDATRNALFDVFMNYYSDTERITTIDTDLQMLPYEGLYPLAKFDLILTVQDVEDKLTLNFTYRSELFKEATITRFGTYFSCMIEQLLENKNTLLKDVQMLPEAAVTQQLVTFNSTDAPYDNEKSIIDLFVSEVATNPDKVALVFEGKELTYTEVDQRSTQLARYINKRDKKKSTLIGICVNRSIEMVVGILGILKSGRGYLPIDPLYPVNRIDSIVEDSGISLLVTTETIAKSFSNVSTILFDKDEKMISKQSLVKLSYKMTSEDLAYVIYTSGSTGRPKGVLVSHKSVVKLVQDRGPIGIKHTDRVLQWSNVAFDGSVYDIFGSLLKGATLYLIDKKLASDLKGLADLIKENELTVAFMTTALFNVFVDTELDGLAPLRKVLFGGERVSIKHVQNAYDALGPERMIHCYGPTETTVYATYYAINERPGQIVPIGGPLSNTTAYVFDANTKLCGVGVVGELHIGGDGLSLGYLNDDEFTASKFVENPYRKGTNVYKTGDLVKWMPDGNLEFVGRKDNQVKLRGYRIELSEIEFQLNAHELVDDSTVLAKEVGNERHLVAYYQSKKAVAVSEMRAYLSELLPEYMVPSYYVQLEAFPLNANGKIDKKALPDHEIDREIGYVAPSNELERKLVNIWAQVLKLDAEVIGVTSSFFDFGGDSLRMVFLANSINKEFKVKISLKEIMTNPTILHVGKLISESVTVDHLQIPAAQKRDYYPLSPSQKRMYFIYEFDKESVAYNVPMAATFKGDLDIDQLESSFKKLVQRHESLRTIFELVDGEVVQRVLPEVEFSMHHLALGEDLDSTVQEFIKPFDLSQSPLLRLGLIKISEKEHVILMDCHHIVTDEVNNNIILKDFASLYKGEELEELRIQYKDFLVWQEGEQQQQEIAKHKEYWLNKFSEEVPTLELPYDYQRPSKRTDQGESCLLEFDKAQVAKLKKLAQSEGLTMYTLFLAMYNVLLYKLSNQNDIVIGTPVVGRPHKDLETIAGLFINTLPMRNKLEGATTFKKFVQQVQQDNSQDLDHQLYPYEDLVDTLNIERNLSRNALFDVFFTFQKEDINALEISDFTVESHTVNYKVSKFDLTMVVVETEDEISVRLEYASKLFKKKTVERFVTYFNSIVTAVCNDTATTIADIEILEDRELKLLSSFNPAASSFPDESTIVDIFEKQVAETPSNIAATFKSKQYRYDELNEKVNQLARCLQKEYGIAKGDIVGVLIPKSDATLLSILAILKLGAAYLPIDPKYPIDRINYIGEDSGLSALVIADDESVVNVPGAKIIDYAKIDFSKEEKANLNTNISPSDLAYVIYTSGSTGHPKGVMIEHGSNVNMSLDQVKLFGVQSSDTVLWFASVAFDASVSEIMMALYCGATLAIPEEEVIKDTALFTTFLAETNTSVVTFPPGYLEMLPLDALRSLRCIITAGEAANAKKAFEVIKRGIRYFNAYGPTECAVCVSAYEVSMEDKLRTNIPIGRPIANTEVVILNDDLQPVPVGVQGTVYVAGKGVARGYLNKPDLTTERFVTLPGSTTKRFYNTGDLGEWTPNGILLFHGRKDNQIKLRGYRVELGEIEGVLASVNGIRNSCVVVREGNGRAKELVGFISLETHLDMNTIHEQLAALLPDHMIPRLWVELDEFPFTVNGKIDKNRLLEYNVKRNEKYEAPVNDIEETLVDIWSEVLKLEDGKLSVTGDFFDLGGNSLIAIQITTAINKHFGIQIELQEIFKLKTVRKLSELIDLNMWIDDEEKEESTFDETII